MKDLVREKPHNAEMLKELRKSVHCTDDIVPWLVTNEKILKDCVRDVSTDANLLFGLDSLSLRKVELATKRFTEGACHDVPVIKNYGLTDISEEGDLQGYFVKFTVDNNVYTHAMAIQLIFSIAGISVYDCAVGHGDIRIGTYMLFADWPNLSMEREIEILKGHQNQGQSTY